ncbi:hypothetical protein EZI54_21210 [Marinobacter halodurans]|uniref:LRAT domain-containing protein n=1 Tax=Marinobacter halodurans TaxID=2528979 RepID=A0ABY1ZEI1_9GAMM|nr:hypothetical protein [Marinobacter halodurans]TBW48514.1 hypothetical protein EZI54_21210 [Marinobacter halodurans]
MYVYSSLKVGDLLYRVKGIVEHAGVYLGAGRVLHIRPGGPAVAVPFSDYSEGKSVSVRRLPLPARVKEGFEKRLAEVIQNSASYRLFSNNCEHVAYYLTVGERISPQLQAALGIGLAGGLLLSQGKLSNFMVAAGVAGVGALLLSNANRQCEFVIEA